MTKKVDDDLTIAERDYKSLAEQLKTARNLHEAEAFRAKVETARRELIEKALERIEFDQSSRTLMFGERIADSCGSAALIIAFHVSKISAEERVGVRRAFDRRINESKRERALAQTGPSTLVAKASAPARTPASAE